MTKRARRSAPVLTEDEVAELRRLLSLSPEHIRKHHTRGGRRREYKRLPPWVEEYFK